MLPADDRGPDSDPSAGHRFRPAASADALRDKAKYIKGEIDPVSERFLRKRPTPEAAEKLADDLSMFFIFIEKSCLPKAGEGQRVSLKRLRKAAQLAAIGISDLGPPKPESNYERLGEIHDLLRSLQTELNGLLD